MEKNGKNGHLNTLDVADSPYLSRANGSDGKGETDGQAQAVSADDLKLPPVDAGSKRGRRWRVYFYCTIGLLVVCIGLGLYAKYGGHKKVSYQIAETKNLKPTPATQQTQSGPSGSDGPSNQITNDAVNQAKEALRRAGGPAAQPAPSATPEVSMNDKQAAPGSGPAFPPYLIPDPPSAAAAGASRGVGTSNRGMERAGNENAGNSGRSAGGAAGSNTTQPYRSSSQPGAYSIYVVPAGRGASATNPPGVGRTSRTETRGASAAVASVKVPSFGAMLPVRSLGAIYTLRQGSLARFEVTRDRSGDGWTLKRGTVLVAQQQGNEDDRAFLTLMGFIDPDTNRFIRLSGDVLGGDGAPGLRGKKRKIGSSWGRVLNRVASSGLALGQAALSRGNSTVIVPGGSLAGYGSEFGLSQSTLTRREFVEVSAGVPAYVMVTDLPKEVRGADADPVMPNDENSLTDEEWANLLSDGTPNQIREALPRMPAEMRKVAEMVISGK